MNTAILTTENNWINPYIADLGYPIYYDLPSGFDALFILNYPKILTPAQLKQNTHNLVIHASDLPHGRGWSPYIWEITAGGTEITLSLIEAVDQVDAGPYYVKLKVPIPKTALLPEIRDILGEQIATLVMFYRIGMPGIYQEGTPTYYPKRNPALSELDPNMSIKDQFNLLRVCDNETYPAFFYLYGKKYILKVYEDSGN